MKLAIHTPTGNTRGPLATESLLRAMHRASRSVFSLSIRSAGHQTGLSVEIPRQLRPLFLQELQDAYPGITVSVQGTKAVSQNSLTMAKSIGLTPDFLTLRTYDQFLDVCDGRSFSDPIAGLFSALGTKPNDGMAVEFLMTLRPIRGQRLHRAAAAFVRWQRGFRSQKLKRMYLRLYAQDRLRSRWGCTVLGRLARPLPERIPCEDKKLDEPLFECQLVVSVSVDFARKAMGERKLEEITTTLGRFHSAASFTSDNHSSFLLTPREVATLWHPLTESADSVAGVTRSEFKELEPPIELTSKKREGDSTILGRLHFRRQNQQFGISTDDLRRHLIAVGKTGCGKSTFLLNLVRQQMETGRGIIVLDPHGQLTEDILGYVPKQRTNDVIYLDAATQISPVGFNPMVGPPGMDETLVADAVLSSFKNVFGFDEGSAPRLLHIFRNTLLSLIGTPHASLSAVQRMLVDTPFQKSITAQVSNDAVRSFWATEFNRWNERDRTQYVASLQNKLGAFTTNSQLRRILDCGQQGIQLRKVMDGSQILLCNLSKGRFGHDASKLLGSLLLSSLKIAAMGRADVPESERPDCVVVIDEFHSYLAEGNSTMADALAESRKYRTSYVLSTQMLDGQLDTQTLTGVLGNCGSTLCMTVGPRDATLLAELLGHGLTADDLMQTPKYHGYLKTLVDGVPHSFSMQTVTPPRPAGDRAATIRRVSRQRYGNSRPI